MAVGRGCAYRAALILLCLVSPVWADIEGPTSRPNILLIVAEDMSPRVGAYGDAVARTPAIDQLARDGLRYDKVFTVSGVCAPSRSSLMTGVYATSMGTHQMRTSQGVPGTDIATYDSVPPPEVKAFPELLRANGYATANFAKKDYQFGDPFTIWDLHKGGFLGPLDTALWRQLPADKPWFVMINLMTTHESRLFESGGKFPEQWSGVMGPLQQERDRSIPNVTDQSLVTVPPYLPDTPRVRASIAQHYNNIHAMDAQVSTILNELEADGLTDSTIVIWTTDHGDGFPRAKRAVYESGTRVPLIMRFPHKRDAGVVEHQLVSFVDIAPTILRLANVTIPEFIQGQDIFSGAPRKHIFSARDRMDGTVDRVRAVRDDRYRLIENFQPELAYFRPLLFRDMFPIMDELWRGDTAGVLNARQSTYFETPRPTYELYDLHADPHEVENLAGHQSVKDIQTRLVASLSRWQEEFGDLGDVTEHQMVLDMWGGSAQPITQPPRITRLVHNVTSDDDDQNHEGIRIELSAVTPGSSLGYRIDGAGWQLYSEPFTVGKMQVVEAKAIRYGYQESGITRYPMP